MENIITLEKQYTALTRARNILLGLQDDPTVNYVAWIKLRGAEEHIQDWQAEITFKMETLEDLSKY